MFNLIARGLSILYDLPLPIVGGSYGFAIILLTLVVMVVLSPLTYKATKSTIKMQEVQPKLKELQRKYKDDRQTLHQELAALYQENGINPVGGCLPMVAQLPVFLVLFNVLRGLSRRVGETPYFTISERAREMVGAGAVESQTFDPQYLSHDSAMYQDLAGSSEMKFWIFDLAKQALDVVRSDFLLGLAYVVLILFVVGTSYYQQKQISARRKAPTNPSDSPMQNQQEMILKFLPLLTGVWSFVFPAGLVIYWATSNVFRIVQQGYITRALYGEENEAANSSLSIGSGDNGLTDRADSSASSSEKEETDSAPSDSKRKNSRNEATKETKSGIAAVGAEGTGAALSRSERWEQMRSQKERTRSRKAVRGEEQSTRTTPRGTKPSSAKRKRKR